MLINHLVKKRLNLSSITQCWLGDFCIKPYYHPVLRQSLDMGIAKQLEGSLTYTTCGSAAYFAPELIAQQGYGLAVDWWALGACF